MSEQGNEAFAYVDNQADRERAETPALRVPSHGHGLLRPAWTPEEARELGRQVGARGGRPKGADPRAALWRRMARNPDEDGIGAESVALADELIDAFQALKAARAAGDEKQAGLAERAVNVGLKLLEYVQPNAKEINKTSTERKVQLNIQRTQVVASGKVASTIAPGPIQDAPLPLSPPPSVTPVSPVIPKDVASLPPSVGP